MDVNLPDVLGEVTVVFLDYERALTENDVAALTSHFWCSELTIRYGAGENLYGSDEIEEFRRSRPSGPRPRKLLSYVITTFGADFATANAEYELPGDPLNGRQSQVWVRTADGWRIVSAHVSFMAV